MTQFYTYLWLREDGTPYYVGKGTGNRAYVKRTHRFNPPPLGRIVLYIAKDEAEALETEVALIWYYGRKDLGTGCLRNLTDGGENPPVQWRNKNNLGKKCTEQTRDKMSLAHKGKPRTWKSKGFTDKHHTTETIVKIKRSLTGKKFPPNRKTLKGKPWSEARRQAQK